MRCKACDSVMSYKNKKPLTSFSGEMLSVFTDKVEGFPRNEIEDICPRCATEIRNYSIDINDQIAKKGFGQQKDSSECFKWNTVRLQEDDEFIQTTDCPDLRFDVEFERVEKEYHGNFKYTE